MLGGVLADMVVHHTASGNDDAQRGVLGGSDDAVPCRVHALFNDAERIPKGEQTNQIADRLVRCQQSSFETKVIHGARQGRAHRHRHWDQRFEPVSCGKRCQGTREEEQTLKELVLQREGPRALPQRPEQWHEPVGDVGLGRDGPEKVILYRAWRRRIRENAERGLHRVRRLAHIAVGESRAIEVTFTALLGFELQQWRIGPGLRDGVAVERRLDVLGEVGLGEPHL
mmetsp:Transcript_39133/g.118206  ORF Transcript_39133/g.118206 Transcript_39133/m.118206 type:complete len:227 (-) Transcript_39133:564-1244(-)